MKTGQQTLSVDALRAFLPIRHHILNQVTNKQESVLIDSPQEQALLRWRAASPLYLARALSESETPPLLPCGHHQVPMLQGAPEPEGFVVSVLCDVLLACTSPATKTRPTGNLMRHRKGSAIKSFFVEPSSLGKAFKITKSIHQRDLVSPTTNPCPSVPHPSPRGASTTSLGRLFRCSSTLSVKKFIPMSCLNPSWSNPRLFFSTICFQQKAK